MEQVLHPSQQKAVAQLRSDAVSLRAASIDSLTQILRMSNLSLSSLDLAITCIRERASVVLHFHPDRPVGLRTVVRGLLEDGIYKSQFETGISNGSVSAHPGGARDEWERSLFNGAYSGVEAMHRPKYGALDLMRNSDGLAPRFGSCFLYSSPRFPHARPLPLVARKPIRSIAGLWTSFMPFWLPHSLSASRMTSLWE